MLFGGARCLLAAGVGAARHVATSGGSQHYMQFERVYPIANWRLHPLTAAHARRLRGVHHVYKVVGGPHSAPPQGSIKLILADYVRDLGRRGTVVLVPKRRARTHLLPAGQAVYVTPDNVARFGVTDAQLANPVTFNYAEHLCRLLGTMRLPVPLNRRHECTVDAALVSLAFRCAGLCVPPTAIQMPPATVAYKPPADASQPTPAAFDFQVTVSINDGEFTSAVQCRTYFVGQAAPARSDDAAADNRWSIWPSAASDAELLVPPPLRALAERLFM